MDNNSRNRNECNVCKKRLSNWSALQNHMRIHSGERPFECTLCGRNFSQRSSLNVHHQTHTGHRPYECELCSKSFYQSSDLKRHMVSHRGKKEISGKEHNAQSNATARLSYFDVISKMISPPIKLPNSKLTSESCTLNNQEALCPKLEATASSTDSSVLQAALLVAACGTSKPKKESLSRSFDPDNISFEIDVKRRRLAPSTSSFSQNPTFQSEASSVTDYSFFKYEPKSYQSNVFSNTDGCSESTSTVDFLPPCRVASDAPLENESFRIKLESTSEPLNLSRSPESMSMSDLSYLFSLKTPCI